MTQRFEGGPFISGYLGAASIPSPLKCQDNEWLDSEGKMWRETVGAHRRHENIQREFPYLLQLPLLSPSVNREAVINSHLLWRRYCPLVRSLLSFQAYSQKALFNSPSGARFSDRSVSYVIGPSLLLFVSALSFSFVLFGAVNAAGAPFGHVRVTHVCVSFIYAPPGPSSCRRPFTHSLRLCFFVSPPGF